MAAICRGALIVFEGCDKSGKSTQCKKLVEYLTSKNTSAELWRFPERSTAIGHVIDDYIAKRCELHDRAVHLLFSANRWEMVNLMKEKLNAGVSLIVDRYAFSGVAFTSAKGIDIEWCKSCDRGLPNPDAVFYMDISVDDASSRGDFGGERYEVSDFQKIVQKQFHELKEATWRMINAKEEIVTIHENIRQQVDDVINSCKTLPLKENLWLEQMSNGL